MQAIITFFWILISNQLVLNVNHNQEKWIMLN